MVCVDGMVDQSTTQNQSTELTALSPRKRAKQRQLEAARSAARIKSTKGRAKSPSVCHYEQLPNLSFATSIPNIFTDLSEQPLKAALPTSVYEKVPDDLNAWPGCVGIKGNYVLAQVIDDEGAYPFRSPRLITFFRLDMNFVRKRGQIGP